jgi:two-component system NtrC family sensor kinase
MSLKKKIAISFFISAFIIAILAAFEYINFIEIRKEIRFLEITDTIRSNSLQLRRHEKNFFLYPLKAKEESEAIHKYIGEINTTLNNNLTMDKSAELSRMKDLINDYGQRFEKIKLLLKDMSGEFNKEKVFYKKYSNVFPIIEFTFYERPLQGAEFLEKVFLLPPSHKLIIGLKELEFEMSLLRKNGEDMINISKGLDKIARENVENTIYVSRFAMLIFFPLFVIVGIGMLYHISNTVVKRLTLLIDVVEKTGKGNFSQVVTPSQRWGGDEVEVLIQKFNNMEEELVQREEELDQKNKELLQSKKLAAIGTLASGVAHELNNPLNNIYISTQVLAKKINETSSQSIREVVADIHSQTLRVKRIVGDLLEFARGREPQLMEVELNNLITVAYKLVENSLDMGKVRFMLDSDPNGVIISADPEQIERVFINLFTNAVDAMSGKGDLIVKIISEDDFIKIKVSDTGKGMPSEAVENIFEPFFTTKDKGTGLGLAIAFNIMKKHNGEISVQSEEGKGTTFTITLPKVGRSHGF